MSRRRPRQRRRISGFADLDSIEFVARIDIGTDTNGEEKKEIRAAVTPDHARYTAVMHAGGMPDSYTGAPATAPQAASHPDSARLAPASARLGHAERREHVASSRQKRSLRTV